MFTYLFVKGTANRLKRTAYMYKAIGRKISNIGNKRLLNQMMENDKVLIKRLGVLDKEYNKKSSKISEEEYFDLRKDIIVKRYTELYGEDKLVFALSQDI
jgi:hypothetical protein